MKHLEDFFVLLMAVVILTVSFGSKALISFAAENSNDAQIEETIDETESVTDIEESEVPLSGEAVAVVTPQERSYVVIYFIASAVFLTIAGIVAVSCLGRKKGI